MQALTSLLAGVEVIHDYAADDLDASLDQDSLLTAPKLAEALNTLVQEMERALDDSRRSAPLRSGVSVAICGPPNVGKSTLFNALVGHERSITAAQPGTTRDYVSAQLEDSDLHLNLIDTAGYHEAADAVEAAGVRRAGEWARAADIVLWVNAADCAHQPMPAELRGSQPLEVLTRCDLLAVWPEPAEDRLCVSGLDGRGVAKLREQLQSHLLSLGEAALDSFSQRQAGQIVAARDALRAACVALMSGIAMDAASMDIYRARELLHGIYEQSDRDAVVNTIFGDFCVGK